MKHLPVSYLTNGYAGLILNDVNLGVDLYVYFPHPQIWELEERNCNAFQVFR